MPASKERLRQKAEWDRKNTTFVPIKFFHATESDLLEFMDSRVDRGSGTGRGTILKQALRMYMGQEIAAGRYEKKGEQNNDNQPD